MVKRFIRENIIIIAAIAVALGIFIVLNCFFPYSGDDWYWGSKTFSWESITTENGRYLGALYRL